MWGGVTGDPRLPRTPHPPEGTEPQGWGRASPPSPPATRKGRRAGQTTFQLERLRWRGGAPPTRPSTRGRENRGQPGKGRGVRAESCPKRRRPAPGRQSAAREADREPRPDGERGTLTPDSPPKPPQREESGQTRQQSPQPRAERARTQPRRPGTCQQGVLENGAIRSQMTPVRSWFPCGCSSIPAGGWQHPDIF